MKINMLTGTKKNIFDVVDDYNRIKLREIPDIEGSDYINASYMDVSFFFVMYSISIKCISCYEKLCTVRLQITHISEGLQKTSGVHSCSRYVLAFNLTENIYTITVYCLLVKVHCQTLWMTFGG